MDVTSWASCFGDFSLSVWINEAPLFSYFVLRASLLFAWSNKNTKPKSEILQKLHDYNALYFYFQYFFNGLDYTS